MTNFEKIPDKSSSMELAIRLGILQSQGLMEQLSTNEAFGGGLKGKIINRLFQEKSKYSISLNAGSLKYCLDSFQLKDPYGEANWKIGFFRELENYLYCSTNGVQHLPIRHELMSNSGQFTYELDKLYQLILQNNQDYLDRLKIQINVEMRGGECLVTFNYLELQNYKF